ncbi:hypothetical protein BJ508DRAFT_114868 [Ascobolus immersus RN42]|uniref:Uncharacterized protein n=1 Tax=Ascobolus immersus RN42 TaxID=1160509 RepID=A0A3N4I4Z6_ASCIM|nr:hypothetical protein BJ508DRAFT_114868 [Ascobolus immersus RN42]
MTQMYKHASTAVASVPSHHHTPAETPRGGSMSTPGLPPQQTPMVNHHHQPSPSPYPTVRPYSAAPPQYHVHHSQSPAPIPPTAPMAPGPQPYTPPNPEVTAFIVPDIASKVPPEIAQYFQRDAEGNILFFRTPPIAVNKPVVTAPGRNGQIVGHSLAYLAKKKELDENRKRKERELEERREENKRKKMELEEQVKTDAQKAMVSALEVYVQQLEK